MRLQLLITVIYLLGNGFVIGMAMAQEQVGDSLTTAFEPREFVDPKVGTLKYRLLKPIRNEPRQKVPLVIFLHGAGERGDDNTAQLVHGMQEFIAPQRREKYPCYVLAPQCPSDKKWVEVDWSAESHKLPEIPSVPLQLVRGLVQEMIETENVDKNRIYITGLSMGGYGTWDAIARYPELFAAAVPICGGGDPATVDRFSQLPIWCFHGDQDQAVSVERSRQMVQALKAAGGDPKYTGYAGVGHDSWTATYANPELYEWLFAKKKNVEVTAPQIEAAIGNALRLLETSSIQTADSRTCFNCHGQALPVLALTRARDRGFVIDQVNLQRQLDHTHQHLSEGVANYLEGKGQGGQVDTAGYAAATLKAGNWPADEVTTAVVEYLLKYQSEQNHWSSSSNRPPSEVSDFSATYVALVALDHFGTPEQHSRIAQRKNQVQQWLLAAPTGDTEDEVFRLKSLRQLAVDPHVVRDKAAELIAKQRAAGGWAQTAEMASDAYATATVLVALTEAADVRVDDPVYQRGIQYLIQTQHADGSWHVVSRSKPFQEYFESGFPHGVDQFISATATGWAVLALLPAMVPGERE